MSKRPREDAAILSLDSFLDIVTNVVGVLILVAVVTVLGASDIGVSAGASALSAPRPQAERALFECAGDQVFFIDERGNGRRVREAVLGSLGEQPLSTDAVVSFLRDRDIGDRTHRVLAEGRPDTVAWIYELRDGARGEAEGRLDDPGSAFLRRLEELPEGGFAYFVVHDDSFAVFRKARDLARSRGIPVGWHPVEGKGPVRLSGLGSLGKRIQ